MKKIILASVLFLMAFQLFNIANDAGVFRSVGEEIGLSKCIAVPGPVGAEDITIDRVSKLAYISADDRRQAFLDADLSDYPNGGIWVLDLSKPDSKPVQLDLKMKDVFHPHGIALRFSDPDSIDKGRAIELYAVNHKDMQTHEITVFTIQPSGQLKLRRRISYPQLISPNDIIVAGKDRFFVTNDHGNPRHTPMELIEDYLGLPLSSVSYFDGEKGQLVIKNIRYPNGLALSKDQQTLYVAQTTANLVSRYHRGEDMTTWSFNDSVHVDSAVDNLEWDGQGRLLTGSHLRIFDFVAHMEDENNPSPSEVIRVDVSADTMTYERLYRNSGEEISGSSVAAQLGSEMLIGSVFESFFLRCQM
jgi:hypothetical protein